MKKIISKLGLIFLSILFFSISSFGQTALASSGGAEKDSQNTVTIGENGTEVYAGVVVDYMGKLRFYVRDKDTMEPIEGASIEIFVKGLNRYVLFGLSDAQGYYELDVAYQVEEKDADLNGQYVEKNGQLTFNGSLAIFQDNQILWKVYKNDYLPYPERGEVYLDAITLPYQIDVFLYREKVDSTDETGNPSPEDTNKPRVDTGKPSKDRLPKTGVKRVLTFWILGFTLCMIAVILIIILLRKVNKEDE